ncbi:O-antigen ligase family protein [Pediococcus parvulus]|uniref:O-antigen ligase family protein n=1 Tax=Pediococcus parvulus TaxID=54062 RepID=UPI0021A664F2|nr:O-antigen ligase family protein [Pediococcus parvulus]MCT3034568.1 O-antigen ligase domain-containing protein [Pediococcus parvulus]
MDKPNNSLKTILNWEEVLDYASALLIILQCNSIFFRETNSKISIQRVLFVCLFVLALKSIYVMAKRNLNFFPITKFVLLYLLVVGSYLAVVASRSQISQSAILMLLIVPVLLVVYFYCNFFSGNMEGLLFKIENLVLIMAGISIFFWVLSEQGFPTNMSKSIFWGSQRVISGYYNIHFIPQGSIEFLGMNMIRNTGLFVEAPMYSYVLCSALLIELFLRQRRNWFNWRVVLLGITIFSTTSSTGIIIVILGLTYYITFISTTLNKMFRNLLLVCFIPILVLVVRYIVISKTNQVWYSSTSLRENDFLAAALAWRQHFWFGNGYHSYSQILQYMDYRRLLTTMNTGFSSGFMEVLAYGGLFGVLIYVIPIFSMIRISKRVFGVAMLFLIMFIITLVNNVILFVVFVAFFWAKLITRNLNII